MTKTQFHGITAEFLLTRASIHEWVLKHLLLNDSSLSAGHSVSLAFPLFNLDRCKDHNPVVRFVAGMRCRVFEFE